MAQYDAAKGQPVPIRSRGIAPGTWRWLCARYFTECADYFRLGEPAVQHLGSCFGLIRAAGMIGVRFGTLPYTEKFVDRCIVRSYRAARRALRTESQLLRSGLRRLRAKLKSSNLPTVARKGQPRADDFKMADGYNDKSGPTPTITIRAEKFKGWFDDQRQPALVCGGCNRRKHCPTSRHFRPTRGMPLCGRRVSLSGLMDLDRVPS